MKRKQLPRTNVQPPDLDRRTLLETTPPAVLQAREQYSQQLWLNARFDAQTTADVLLEQIMIRNSSFQEAELPDWQIVDSVLDTVDLANAALEKPYLRRVELTGCRLLGSKFLDADLEDVLFTRCNARLLRCWNATCRSVRFEQCALQEASFDGANLTGVVFSQCDLSGADLRNAKLHGADLRGSIITGVQVNPGDLRGMIVDPQQALQLIALFGVVVQ